MNSIQLVLGRIDSLFTSKPLRQVGSLYSSHLLVLIAGMAISVLNTRYLGPVNYGLYAFTFAVVDFILLFINFGFYSSGARLLAINMRDDNSQREIIGTLIIVALLLSFLSSLIIFVLSFYANLLFKAQIGNILRMFCLFLGLMNIQALTFSICKGNNRIESLSIYYIMARILTLVLIALFVSINFYSLKLAIAFNLSGFFLSACIIIRRFNPNFANLKYTLKSIFKDVQSYGFKAYLGDIAATASYRTDSLMISYFVNTNAVGYYRLATLLTFPMMNFSKSLSTTLFTKFAEENKISWKITACNFALLISCLLGLIMIGKFIVYLLFGLKYQPVIKLIYPLALTAFFGGMSQPYNAFMGAKGKGTFLRNAAFILTGANISLNLSLIPKYGTIGACYASLIALVINYGLHIYYYEMTRRELQ